MENKEIQKKNYPKWRKRAAMLGMAAILGVTGLSSCKKEEEEKAIKGIKDKAFDVGIEKIIDTEEAIDVVEEVKEEEEPKEEVNFFDTIDLSNYTGYSIVDALELNGYPSDFVFRTELANYFGFDPYKGSEEQNLALLKILGAHVPEKDKDVENNNAVNDSTNGTSSNGQENENNSQNNNSNNNDQKNNGEYCPECDGDHDADHVHLWTEWQYLNDKKEQRMCLICGEIETRKHPMKKATIEYVSQNNGTHKVVKSTKCKSCSHKKEEVLLENCSFEWKYDSKLGKDVGVCKDCGFKQTREPDRHKHQYRLIDTKYTVNDDDTHTTTEIYECIAKDDKREISHTAPHAYTEWQLNPETGLHERQCPFCKHKQTLVHTDDHDYERVIEYFQIEGNTEQHRVVIKDICKYGDDEKIILDGLENCSFGPNWTYNSQTGMDETFCTKCGQIHTRVHECEVEEVIERVEIPDNHEEHLKRVIHKCSICNKETLISETKEPHTYGEFIPNEDHTKETGICNLCNFSYTKDIKHEHKYAEKTEYVEIPEDHEQHILRTINECACGDKVIVSEIKENHAYGAFVPNEDNTKETGICNLCNFSYTKDIAQHEHDYKYLDPITYASLYAEKGVNPETHELLKCETDGTLKIVAHELGAPVIDGCAATKTCTHEYCKHQVVEYSHDESDEFVSWVSSKDVCKLVNVVCTKDGTVIKTNVERGHNWVDASEAYGIPDFKTCLCGRYKCGEQEGLLSDLSNTYSLRNVKNPDDNLLAYVSVERDRVLVRKLTK